MARTDHAIEPGAAREFGDPQHLIVGAARHPGAFQIAVVEAGQQGYRDHLAVFARRSLGVFHHRPPAAAVDGDDCRFEHVDRLHRRGDGVGDIVELEIEEDRQSQSGDLMDPVVAVGAEEFEPQLDPADVRVDFLRQLQRRFELGHVEREIDRVGHAGVSGSEAGAAGISATVLGRAIIASSPAIRRRIRQRWVR